MRFLPFPACPVSFSRLSAAGLFTAALFVNTTPAPAQVGGGFSLVASFGQGNNSGKVPYAPLIQDPSGTLFGTAEAGGGDGAGVVFSLTPGSTISNLYRFHGGDGAVPVAPLVRDAAGTFYSTTEQGGYYDYGTVFALTADGTRTTLHDFGSLDDGVSPEAGLVFGPDGNLYGTTASGGYNNSGTVFRLSTTGGGYTILYDFGSNYNDAATPNAALYLGTDGNLYGTTTNGGYYDRGTVFQITTAGTLTILYDFAGRDGSHPDASLVQASDGNFYGTTSFGGSYDAGTVFSITPAGTLTTLYDFPNKNDGLEPEAALIQATDGLLYGTTEYGGTAGGGTAFSIGTNGADFTTLHSFAGGGQDGANPLAAVVQALDGTLYGTTAYGGAQRVGTVYRLALDLPPAPATVTAAGQGSPDAVFGSRNAKFLVSRAGADLSQPLTVGYALSGTATNGVDYRLLSGTAVIPAGAASVRVKVVPLVAETTTKTLTLTLTAPSGSVYTLGGTISATVQIVP